MTPDGEIIAAGCNEVPKAGGGAVWEGRGEDKGKDYRDYTIGYDSTARMKHETIAEIFERLNPDWLAPELRSLTPQELASKALYEGSAPRLKGTRADSILEFGRIVHAEMLEAADYVLVMAYPDEATTPFAGIILMIPRVIEGRSVEPDWEVLGMRATRSDSLILDECRLPDDAVVFRSEDTRSFRHAYLNWFWGSYTAVYLGLATAAYDELRRVVHTRQPEDYAQPLAYHPDVRRHIAEMSVDLEAARLITYRSAWLSDTEGPTAETTAALYRAKYMVGESVTRITRAALTLGGAHGIFKGSRLEQLFRDGALAPLHPPPADYCLYNMGFFELGLDPADALPPLKPM